MIVDATALIFVDQSADLVGSMISLRGGQSLLVCSEYFWGWRTGQCSFVLIVCCGRCRFWHWDSRIVRTKRDKSRAERGRWSILIALMLAWPTWLSITTLRTLHWLVLRCGCLGSDGWGLCLAALDRCGNGRKRLLGVKLFALLRTDASFSLARISTLLGDRWFLGLIADHRKVRWSISLPGLHGLLSRGTHSCDTFRILTIFPTLCPKQARKITRVRVATVLFLKISLLVLTAHFLLGNKW